MASIASRGLTRSSCDRCPGARRPPARAGLVVGALVEADAEGLGARGAVGLHQRDDGRAVDAAGQEGAERHIGHEPSRHRAGQRGLEARDRLLVRKLRRLGQGRCGLGARVPIEPARHHLAAAHLDPFAGRHAGKALEDRARRRHVAEAHEGGEAVAIDLGAPAGMGEEALGLATRRRRCRRCCRSRAASCPTGRARGFKLRALPVPQGDGEHAGNSVERALDAPAFEAFEHHLRVGLAAEASAFGLELGGAAPAHCRSRHCRR